MSLHRSFCLPFLQKLPLCVSMQADRERWAWSLLTSSLHQCRKQVLSRCGWCYSLVSCWANRRCPLQMAFFQFCNLRHDIFYQCTPTSNGYLQIISKGYIWHVFSIFLKVAWFVILPTCGIVLKCCSPNQVKKVSTVHYKEINKTSILDNWNQYFTLMI